MARAPLKLLLWLHWRALSVWRSLGWSPVLSALMLVLAALLTWHAHELSQQTAGLLEQGAHPDRPASVNLKASPEAVTHGLNAFLAVLPDQDAAIEAVKELFEVADVAGVRLERGDYRIVADTASGLMRYQMTLPVKGEAARIQQFALLSLEKIRTLNLRSISFRRENRQSAALEARIEFELIMREQ